MNERNDTDSGRTTLAWGRGHVRHGRIPEWLLDSDVSDRAIRLYSILGLYADRNGQAFPGRRKIMERLRCKETAYKAAVAELVAVGALDVEPRHRDDGSQKSNLYTLHWSPPESRESDGERSRTRPGRETQRDPLTRARSSSKDLEKTSDLETLATGVAEATDPGPPKLTKVDGRDLAFDTLARVCGVDPSGNRAREVGIALNGSPRSGLAHGIRELHFRQEVALGYAHRSIDPTFERRLAAAVTDRALRYREAMPGAALTPLALAKWWTDVDAARPASAAERAMRRAVDLAEQGR